MGCVSADRASKSRSKARCLSHGHWSALQLRGGKLSAYQRPRQRQQRKRHDEDISSSRLLPSCPGLNKESLPRTRPSPDLESMPSPTMYDLLDDRV